MRTSVLMVLSSSPELELENRNPRSKRYELGQFFTPDPIAKFMAAAVTSNAPVTVLDPAVGGGVLLRHLPAGTNLYGLDLDPNAVEVAESSLKGSTASIRIGNFLDRHAWPWDHQAFDAVICNPPYIRHHGIGDSRTELARLYSKEFGVQISSLSGSYVYFFLESIRRINPGGKLVFITPTEFLDVRYGRALKQVLMQELDIEEVIVLDMEALAFNSVLTTSAITIATRKHVAGKVQSQAVVLSEAKFDGEVVRRTRVTELAPSMLNPSIAWTMLLPSRAERILELTVGRSHTLSEYARVRRGIATADNSFFCLTDKEVIEREIEAEFLVPVVVGARDLPFTGALSPSIWNQRRAMGARCWLFWCHAPEWTLLGTKAMEYIRWGESKGIDQRFNARARDPWYSVESVDPPDYFVTYMSRDRARFVRNDVGARCMTSLLNLWIRPGVDAEEMAGVLADPLNAELLRQFGRTYGGGLGKIEPGELARLPVPAVSTT